jgi:hypothetical protein
MCLSCGCGQPNESHGDPRNITLEKLEESAKAANISAEEAGRNINEGMRSRGSQRPQRA